MTIKIILFLFAFPHIVSAQTVTNIKVIQTNKEFSTVRDSIIKLINPTTSIAIKTCEDVREFYLTKDSLHWEGYFIGVKYEPDSTTLITFNADSLYDMLVSKKLYDVNQITEESIEIIYNQNIKKKENEPKEIIYGLPFHSHDCDMTITNSDLRLRGVTYRNALIHNKDLHCVPTLKIFYDIGELLIKSFEKYYY